MLLLRSALLFALLAVLFGTSHQHAIEQRSTDAMTEEELKEYFKGQYELQVSAMCNRQNIAEWNYNTDVNNKDKEQAAIDTNLAAAKLSKELYEKYFAGLKPEDYKDQLLQRQIKQVIVQGVALLPEADFEERNTVLNRMYQKYSTGRLCPYKKQNCNLETEGLDLDPGLTELLAKSRDYDELLYVWKGWRDVTGAKMRDDFKIYVNLSNKAAELNGIEDYGALWRISFEDDEFVAKMDKLWQDVSPLYNELHKFVLGKLKGVYGSKITTPDGYIPAHLLGNMWAQQWNNIQDIVIPFPESSDIDLTTELERQNYTVERIFETSDDFYKSLGLPPNDMSYDESKGAMITRPPERAVVCHASAWDFCDGVDYRIKMCTKVTGEDFFVVHHEMGHINYFILYKDQPVSLRNGANPGFHEAIGDTIVLSVSTPKHLKKINLLPADYKDTEEANINAMMSVALQRVAFLPFGYLIDKWRWDVFSGKVEEAKWNEHWWELRKNIQKVWPPVERTERDFDAGAKNHVPGDTPYISYFFAHILQFQLHKALCLAAGEYDPKDPLKPLHQCDIYKSKAAGDLMRAGLSLGNAKHWTEALKELTGESELSGSALLEYFKPLYEFLKKENAKNA